jgi:multimeric flavodoxin WrbA
MPGSEDIPRRFVALNCTLKHAPDASSTEVLLDAVTGELEALGFTGETVRVVDEHLARGVTADEGEGDGWPAIRQRILDAQLLVLGTPIWLGHPASVTQQVLERLDAFLGETDDRGQMATVDRVAIVAVVGNEDGAHHVGAELFQGLDDVGFTLPPGAMTYWVGEAMGSTDLKDLDAIPEKTMTTARTMAANAAHLVGRLGGEGAFPSLS